MLKFHSLFLHNEVCSHFLCPMRERHGNTFYFLLWPQIKLGEGMVHRRLSYFWGCFFFLHRLPSGPRCPLLVQEYVFQAVQREASSLRICLVSDRRYTGWLLSIITTYSPICIYHKKNWHFNSMCIIPVSYFSTGFKLRRKKLRMYFL